MVAAVRWVLVTGRDRDLVEASWDRGRQWRVVRVALALALLVLLLGEFGRGYQRQSGWPLFLTLLALHVFPVLLLVSRRALTAWRAAVLGTVVTTVTAAVLGVADPWTPAMLSYAPVLTLVIARVTPPRAVAAAGVSLLVTAATGSLAAVVAVTCLIGAGGLLGRFTRIERRLDVVSRSMAEERTRRAVLEERARIAGELHDVLAHHLSLIAVRTETAPFRLETVRAAADDDPLRAEFRALGGATRQALDETRRLLDVLRDEADLDPQPTLDQIPDLVAEAGRSGMPVRHTVRGEPPGGVTTTVGLVGYRIVQEALSNAGRHAPGAPVEVRVHYQDGWVRVDVENEAPEAAGPRRQAGGHGLRGMRQRVGVVRGTLHAGPRADGGFTVSATLPIPTGADR